MNRRERLVQEQYLNNEQAIIRRLKAVYKQSLKDIETKAQTFQSQIEGIEAIRKEAEARGDIEAVDKLLSMARSKIYQKQYQEALKKQIGAILDNMQAQEFDDIESYLKTCYDDGFIGAIYDLHGQGIPVTMPIPQESMVRAVQLDSKISEGLYSRLGEDTALLKKKITAQVSRGISTGQSWQQVAQGLSGYTNIGYNNAVRIARTEGHRIQGQAQMDACQAAKEKGADVVKQWDASLDARTRESHQKVDGEIREIDKPFSNGLMFPGDPKGPAAEVINCRCALLQRAKWALDESELQTLKDRAKYFGLDKAEGFQEFKDRYIKTVYTAETVGSGIGAMAKKPIEPIEVSAIINEAISKKRPFYAEDLIQAYVRYGVIEKDGCYDVLIHGNQFLVEYEHKYNLDDEMLYMIISGRRDYKAYNIRLLSCSTGKENEFGDCFAKRLAKRLGVRVYAPIDTLNIEPGGKLTVGRMRLPEKEGFKWFDP